MKLLPKIFILISVFAMSCDDRNKYEIKSNDKYENSKQSLAVTEQKNPDRFLTVQGNNKKNMLGQTVVIGKVYNNAKVVSYKDIDIKLSFYSKTGTLLEEDHEIVYETIHPGYNANFKSKYFTPKGTDSVAMHVVGAKY